MNRIKLFMHRTEAAGTLILLLFYFAEKIRLDIPSEPTNQTIHMKCQVLFSLTNSAVTSFRKLSTTNLRNTLKQTHPPFFYYEIKAYFISNLSLKNSPPHRRPSSVSHVFFRDPVVAHCVRMPHTSKWRASSEEVLLNMRQ